MYKLQQLPTHLRAHPGSIAEDAPLLLLRHNYQQLVGPSLQGQPHATGGENGKIPWMLLAASIASNVF